MYLKFKIIHSIAFLIKEYSIILFLSQYDEINAIFKIIFFLQLLFSFLLCINILKASGTIDEEEWHFLLTGGIGIGNPDPNPYPWLPDKSWEEICRLTRLKSFTGLRESLKEEETGFQSLFESLVLNL